MKFREIKEKQVDHHRNSNLWSVGLWRENSNSEKTVATREILSCEVHIDNFCLLLMLKHRNCLFFLDDVQRLFLPASSLTRYKMFGRQEILEDLRLRNWKTLFNWVLFSPSSSLGDLWKPFQPFLHCLQKKICFRKTLEIFAAIF